MQHYYKEENMNHYLEMDKFMPNILDTYVTVHNIKNLSSERIFVSFMNAIYTLLEMDASDVADREDYHYEWTAKRCWEVMHQTYKEQILAAIPDIAEFMYWGGVNPDAANEFYEFRRSAFYRVLQFEKAEIIKRAQTKMLKEELAMKVMHPDRIEKLINTYNVDILDFY